MKFWSSLVAQQIKDLVLLLLWLGLLLWYWFSPWPSNFYIPWASPPPRRRPHKTQNEIMPFATMQMKLGKVLFLVK